jgi:hypothetical protein
MLFFLLLFFFFSCYASQSPLYKGPLVELEKKDSTVPTQAIRSEDAAPMVRAPLIGIRDVQSGDCLATLPADTAERPRAIWEQPVCPPCPCPSGRPISYGRLIECAFVKIKPYGYVKWEGFWDTRQVIGSREEQALLYPKPRRLDIFGQDIESHGKWDMLAIETRIGLGLEGPRWGDIRIDGLIETDFRGPSDPITSVLRLRHAFGRVVWENGSFLYGQWWHPLFILECFPHTVAFAIGAPMEPQARDPQLRYTGRWGWFELIAAAASQSDFLSNGPIGFSAFYIRQAVIPNLHLQMRGYFKDNVVGVAADYKRLVPRIESDKNVKVNEFIDSFIFEAFAAFIYAPWSLRTKVFWAQNGTDQLLISGYGVHTINPVTDARTYTNTAAAGGWLDFSYLFGCDNHELGFFVGGTKNLGSRQSLFIDPETGQPIIYALSGLAQNLDYVVRVSPRYIFMKDPIRFGAEVEWTRASWGTPNRCGKVRNGVPVDNIRILLALYYMF